MEEMKAEHQRHEHKPRRAGRYIGTVILILGVLAVAAALTRRESARTDDPGSDAPAGSSTDVIEATTDQLKQIRIEPVREQLVDLDLETTGKVGFNEDRMTPVIAPYAGRVLEILANKGDVVAAGQPVLVIESPDLIVTVNDLAEARSSADKARIELDAADKAAQRARRLHDQEALATKDLQSAEADLAKAQQEYRHALTAASVVRNRLALFGKTPAEISALEQSNMDQIDRRITIPAPLAGTIVERKVGPGQYVKPDSPDPLYLISDLSTVWVTADVYESYLPLIRPGAPVEITVAAYADRKFPAKISSINPTVDPATRTIHVRCLVLNSTGLLKPEMFANIRIGKAVHQKVPAIPSTAILSQGPQSYVLIEESSGKFRRHSVKPGRESQGLSTVEEGLHNGDRVVVSGALLLSNGLNGK